MAPKHRRASAQPSRAFTLIELLVVIAIIAILTAILLPVFASVRENSRQGVAMSNMKDIQQKMEQFKLDNHRYPDVLFGYADGNGDMKGALGRAEAAGQAATYFPGLYPAYIKDPEVFTDPNNTVNTSDTAKFTGQLPVTLIYPCNDANDEALSGSTTSACTAVKPPVYGAGATVLSSRNFYLADAYDSGPTVMGTNQLNNPLAYLVRYQIAREGTACNGGKPVGCDSTIDLTNATVAENYKHQLRWQNPPADSVITLTSYHVKNADKVLVMFESGAVKKMTGADFAAKEGSANFWQVTP